MKSTKQFGAICVVALIVILSLYISEDQTENDNLTGIRFQIRIFAHRDGDYILYLPLPVNNGTSSPVVSHLKLIEGNAQFDIINTSRGNALKIVGNGSIEILGNGHFNIETGAVMTMLNSSAINPGNGQTEHTYWLYFNSSSSINMTLISNYSEGYRSGDHHVVRNTWVEFGNRTLIDGWQLVEGYEHSEDFING